MSVPSLLDINGNGLQQVARVACKDQDPIVVCHDRVPIARLGECGGGGAIWKKDHFGQRNRRLIVSDDNHRGDHYDPRDHCNGQNRHQPSQKAQVRWFRELIIGNVVHV